MKYENVAEKIEAVGFVTFNEFKEFTGKTVGKAYDMESLKNDGLRVTRLDGEKVLADLNKTKTALSLLKGAGEMGVEVEAIYEINQWDAHVTGSVFRKANRDKYGIEKIGKLLVRK